MGKWCWGWERPRRERGSGGRMGDGACLMWAGDKTPLVLGAGRRAGPLEQLLLLAPVFGGVDFFLFEELWKIVQWQMPWMRSTFLPKTPFSGAELWLPPRLILNHLWSCPQGEGRGRKSLFLRNCLKISVHLWRQQCLSPQDLLPGLCPMFFLAVLLCSVQRFQCKKVT